MFRKGSSHLLVLLGIISIVIGGYVAYRGHKSITDYKDDGVNVQRNFGDSLQTVLDKSYGDESEYLGDLRYKGKLADDKLPPPLGGSGSSDDNNGGGSLIPSPTPSPSPTPVNEIPDGFYKTASGCLVPETRISYMVKPYLVYPADKEQYSEYESAVISYMTELQDWYCQKAGVTFAMEGLIVRTSSFDYLTMRCGLDPSQNCLDNKNVMEGNWGYYMNKAIHDGIEKWEEQTSALIFSVGGGGYAGANVYNNYAGFAIVGDWSLEGISGKRNDWGIHCGYATWQCNGGTPKGTPAHELGHTFALPHPDNNLYPGQSVMRWHGDYPDTGFLPHEIEQLTASPFFNHDVLGIKNDNVIQPDSIFGKFRDILNIIH